ncbi:nucleoside hydrolase-like domain-containing protein [Promicromonospora sukumoe]
MNRRPRLSAEPSRRRPRARLVRGPIAAAAAVALLLPLAAVSATAHPAPDRTAPAPSLVTPGAPRTIITTDPELDDLNSMLRTLLYSNEINLAGLVYSSSQHHWSGDPAAGVEPFRWPAPGDRLHIDQAIDAYAQAYPNLVVHDRRYPRPERVRSLVRVGNIKNIGDVSADTAGSDLIRSVLLDDKPGQVFLQAWGGPNTIARALMSIEEQYKGTRHWDAVYRKIVKKAVITSFGQQDTTFDDYIKPHWPDIQNREVATSVWGYFARNVALPQDQVYLTPAWTRENVSDVGPIGAAYRVWGDGKQMAAGFDDEDYFGLSGYTAAELRAMGYVVWMPPQAKDGFISEGDSSNFALLVDNGLRSWEHPGWGGWGGRQTVDPDDPKRWSNRGSLDADETGATPADYPAARFFSAIQHDFAARLQWSVTPRYGRANHEPAVRVTRGTDVVARPGQTVRLTARASDPDRDAVSLTWWSYAEAGTYPVTVRLSDASGRSTGVTVPSDARPGQTIHVIVQAEDDGSPSLTSYERVVITVKAAGRH